MARGECPWLDLASFFDILLVISHGNPGGRARNLEFRNFVAQMIRLLYKKKFGNDRINYAIGSMK